MPNKLHDLETLHNSSEFASSEQRRSVTLLPLPDFERSIVENVPNRFSAQSREELVDIMQLPLDDLRTVEYHTEAGQDGGTFVVATKTAGDAEAGPFNPDRPSATVARSTEKGRKSPKIKKPSKRSPKKKGKLVNVGFMHRERSEAHRVTPRTRLPELTPPSGQIQPNSYLFSHLETLQKSAGNRKTPQP
ncbi:hypothetical protein FRC14_000285, partial [Serendipita sp. 396]